MIHWVDILLLLCAIVAIRWAYMVGKEVGFYAGLEREYKDREEDLEKETEP